MLTQEDIVRLSNLLSWYNCCVATDDPDRPDISKCTTIKQITEILKKAYDNWRKKNE